VIVAGVDVGNSTTEILIADAGAIPPRPLAWDRMPTRGRKGSAASWTAAAGLVRRMARQHALRVDRVVCAPQRPVATWTSADAGPAPDTGRLRVLARSTGTPGRPGHGAGTPVAVTASPAHAADALVLCVPPGLGFRAAVAGVRGWLDAGADVAAVLLADDEGVLVANRVTGTFPVLDGADVAAALAARRVAVEVSAPGGVLVRLTDPIRLAATLDLPDGERAHARTLAAGLVDAGNAAIGVDGVPRNAPGHAGAAVPRSVPVDVPPDAADTWQVSLADVTAGVEARRDAITTRGTVRSALLPAAGAGVGADGAALLAAELGVPVSVAASEAEAAHAGALSTPGVRPGALVVDIGAGTIDVISAGLLATGSAVTVAGAGDLVTAAAAMLLGIPRSRADWAKRGPCTRVEGPHVRVAEDGTRGFLDQPAPADLVGSLTVPGPAGPLPFHRSLSPPEWRVLRRRLKRAAIGDNLARGLARTGTAAPGDVVLIGGVAGDVEILAVLDRALTGPGPGGGSGGDRGPVIGRGDVAGGAGPGHRWAVAYGLIVLDCDGRTTPL
jgi:hypothetical protein